MWLLALFAVLTLWTPDLTWEQLEASYLRRPEDLKQVQGVRWHVRDEGSARQGVWVLVHGFASDLQTWNAWAEQLQVSNRVVRFDLPGQGLSGPTTDGDYGLEKQCQRLGELLEDLRVGHESPRVPVVWAGHSMGARLLSKCAAQVDRPPDALVLIAPAMALNRSDQGSGQGQPVWAQGLQWVLPQALVRAGLTAAHAPDHPPTDLEVERSHRLLRAPGVRQAMLTSARTPSSEVEPVSRYSGPVLVLWGSQDRLLGPEALKAAQRAWPQAPVHRYAQAGHLVHEDAADASVNDALSFVRRLK